MGLGTSPTLGPTVEVQQAGSNRRPGPRPIATPMIRISITPAAFEAIAATLPLGNVGYEPQLNAQPGLPIKKGRARTLTHDAPQARLR